MGLRVRVNRLEGGRGAADDACRCRECRLGKRLSAAEAEALSAAGTGSPMLARCPDCGGRVRVFVRWVVVKTREEVERFWASRGGRP
jgi:hypothetical protein